MIVVDASALVALATLEPGYERYAEALQGSDRSLIAPINYVETGIVLVSRGSLDHRAELDSWLEELGVSIWAERDLSAGALAAYLRYGKGYHAARLNLADCFAYALARQLDAPLLYKGEDFALTDVRPAIPA